MKNYAYVTLMTHNEYMIPAMVLVEQGKKTNSLYPLYIMITNRITKENQEILSILGYQLIYIEEYIPTNYLSIFNSIDLKGQTDLHGRSLDKGGGVHSFNKFKVGTLTQFEKVCFLDIDLFILHNLDSVFEYPEYTCAGRKGLKEVCSQIFIAEPNLHTYKAICKFADNYIIPFERYNLHNVLYTDEDVFTDFILNKTYLPQYYDYQSFDLNGINSPHIKNDIFNIKAIHFTSKEKPGINNKQFVNNFNPETQYIYIYFGNLYVDIYENILKNLKTKGVKYEKI